jgi:parvulin-like peptidyl-prolyl isomerase
MELARRVDELVKAPSERETREYFEAQGHRFVRRQHYDLSVILIDATSEGLPVAYERALSLREELAAGTIDFAAAARAHSDHPSRADGGHLGPVERPRLAALGRNVFNTIIALEPGAVGRLVQSDLQLWIVKLHEIQPARPLTFEEAQEAVEQALGDERTQTIREAVEEELLRELSLELVG